MVKGNMRISLKHTFPALLTFIQFFQNTHDVLTDAFGISSKVGSPLARRSFLNNAQEGIENADEMELGVVGQRGKRNSSLQDAALRLKRFRRKTDNAAIVEDLFSFSLSPSSNTNSFDEVLDSNVKSLIDLNLIGRGEVGARINPEKSINNQGGGSQPIPCVFLSIPSASEDMISRYLRKRFPYSTEIPTISSQWKTTPALPLALPTSRETSKPLKLLSFAFRERRISKSVFLQIASLLTNRDGAMWDNLPWAEWSVDPLLRNRNADGKMISKKYLLGKRDSYNRMSGKDWYGRSLSTGNVAARVKYGLEDSILESRNEKERGKEGEKEGEKNVIDVEAESKLAIKILQLRIKENQMKLAEAEQEYALLQTELGNFASDEVLIEHYQTIRSATDRVSAALQSLEENEATLKALLEPNKKYEPTVLENILGDFLSGLFEIGLEDGTVAFDDAQILFKEFSSSLIEQENLLGDLDEIVKRENEITSGVVIKSVFDFLNGVIERESKNAPPYRGAMGYAPQIDTKEEMFEKSVLPYTSPYELLLEIIQEQLNSDVVGCVLENSSLFPGTLVLEGAIVLRRRGRKKSVKIGGDEIELEDSDDDFGNDGVKMGSTFVVECDGDEAIGMALTCDLPISVDRRIWEEVSTEITLANVKALKINETDSVLNEIPLVRPVRIDETEVNERGEALVSKSGKSQPQSAVIDEVVNQPNSLTEFDALTIPNKASLILTSEDFEGKLPRHRVLLQFQRKFNLEESSPDTVVQTTLSPLDEIIVPLLKNETVRQEILLRDAKIRNDVRAVEVIQNQNKVEKDEKGKGRWTLPTIVFTLAEKFDEKDKA